MGGGQAGEGDTEGGAGDVVEADLVAELDGGGVAAVFTTDAQLSGSPCCGEKGLVSDANCRLENRLLDLTARRFDEAAYGASSFSEFLSRYTDLVRVDRSVIPPWVLLLEAVDGSPSERAINVEPSTRVRRDLWNAIMDYSSGTIWVWDDQHHRAVPASEAGPGALQLPTISVEELDVWRGNFLQEQVVGLDEEQQAAARAWHERRLGTNALPAQLRGLWNACQKQEVIRRLREWFQQQSIDSPEDLIVVKKAEYDPLFRLREFVVECVRNMSEVELRGLQLPAAAALRSRRGR